MPDDWVEGAERIGCTKTGGSYDGTPYCMVFHTVEGDPDTIGACRSMAESHGSPPQLWYSPRLDWFAQGIPLSRSGYALAHPAGTPETNKAGAIQCELFGFAADTPGWPAAWLEAIGRRVLGGVLRAGYPIDTSQIAPTTGNDGYGEDGAVRFTEAEWATYPGVCCHSNVANNEHWDAGDIDLDVIVAAAVGGSAGTEDDDMTPAYCRDLVGRDWLLFVGDDKALWASVPQSNNGKPWPIGGKFTSGVEAWTAPNGELCVIGRGTDGKLYQVVIYTDGVKSASGHKPGDQPWIGVAIGQPHHLYPPA